MLALRRTISSSSCSTYRLEHAKNSAEALLVNHAFYTHTTSFNEFFTRQVLCFGDRTTLVNGPRAASLICVECLSLEPDAGEDDDGKHEARLRRQGLVAYHHSSVPQTAYAELVLCVSRIAWLRDSVLMWATNTLIFCSSGCNTASASRSMRSPN